MDIQSFIQSGLLESYVLNQCTAEERTEVERMAAAHPEVRAELDAIEQTLERVAFANAVPPPPGLKIQIEQRLQAETGSPGAGAKGFRLTQLLSWAVAALAGIALVAQVLEKNNLEKQIPALQTQIADCETRTQQQARTQEIIALLRDRNTRSILLSDAAPDANTPTTATVWHNPARSETLLDINSLPTPEAGKHFQFWAIVDGKPVSMGMVTLHGADSWQALPYIPNAQAFAISAEDNPNGNPTPTVVVLVGKV